MSSFSTHTSLESKCVWLPRGREHGGDNGVLGRREYFHKSMSSTPTGLLSSPVMVPRPFPIHSPPEVPSRTGFLMRCKPTGSDWGRGLKGKLKWDKHLFCYFTFHDTWPILVTPNWSEPRRGRGSGVFPVPHPSDLIGRLTLTNTTYHSFNTGK